MNPFCKHGVGTKFAEHGAKWRHAMPNRWAKLGKTSYFFWKYDVLPMRSKFSPTFGICDGVELKVQIFIHRTKGFLEFQMLIYFLPPHYCEYYVVGGFINEFSNVI